jgi:hypothetical protein
MLRVKETYKIARKIEFVDIVKWVATVIQRIDCGMTVGASLKI